MISLSEASKFYGITAPRLRQIIEEESLSVDKKPGPRGSVLIPNKTMKKINEKRKVSFEKRIITVGIEKGGVGKTSVSAMLACAAARKGRSVLCLDFDPECCLTQFLSQGEDDLNPDSILEVFETKKQIADFIKPSEIDGIDLLPAKVRIRKVEKLISEKNPATLLRSKMQGLQDYYDLIIFDVPPTWNRIVSAAYLSSDTIIMPVNSDIFSLDSLSLTIEDIRECCEDFLVEVPDIKILKNKFLPSRLNSRQMDAELSEFGSQLLPIQIKQTALIENCINSSTPIFEVRKKESTPIIEAFNDLLELVSPRLDRSKK